MRSMYAYFSNKSFHFETPCISLKHQMNILYCTSSMAEPTISSAVSVVVNCSPPSAHLKVYRCTQIANVKCQELMEKIQAALTRASDEARAVMAPSFGTQHSSIKTSTQDHPTVHATIERKDKDALLASPSTRHHPDVRKLVRLMHVRISSRNFCIPSL